MHKKEIVASPEFPCRVRKENQKRTFTAIGAVASRDRHPCKAERFGRAEAFAQRGGLSGRTSTILINSRSTDKRPAFSNV